MSGRMRWPARVMIGLAWFIVTAGVAFAVARIGAGDDSDGSESLTAAEIQIHERQTVTLTEQTIQPVVSSDGTVVQDTDGASWNLEAPVSPQALAYQLLDPPIGVKALIVGGPAGFDCMWIGLGQGPDGSVTMRCRIPSSIRAVAGLQGTMTLQMAAPRAAESLPVTAVIGGAQQGQVIVVSDGGTTSVRDVSLGAADTFWIEITGGLQPDEAVLAVPVQSDYRADQ